MSQQLTIGFIGIGTIAQSMICGLLRRDNEFTKAALILSPRNKERALALARRYDNVHIVKDNQAVLDACQKVFLCTPSQVTKEVLENLQFRPDHSLISLVAMAQIADLARWSLDRPKIYRAVPLPFVEQGRGLTPIYPADDFLQSFFSEIGGYIALDCEEKFELFLLAGSMMGIYYHFLDICQQNLLLYSLNREEIHHYLLAMFGNLADIMRKEAAPDFALLAREYSTKGGTNELLRETFQKQGGDKALAKAIELTLKRIKGHQ